MVRAADIIATVAVNLGLTVDEITLIARHLREADLFVRETKSPRSWRGAPRDAAHLVAAVLSGASALRAPEALERMKSAHLYSGDDKHLVQCQEDRTFPTINFRCDFVKALTNVFEWSSSSQENQNNFDHSYICYEMFGNSGEIYLCRDNDYTYPHISVVLQYGDDNTPGPDGLSQTRRIGFPAIRRIARIFSNA